MYGLGCVLFVVRGLFSVVCEFRWLLLIVLVVVRVLVLVFVIVSDCVDYCELLLIDVC